MASPDPRNARFWVALPGRGKAVEMTRAELLAARTRGDLPAGTLIARFGTQAWVPSDRIDELVDQRTPAHSHAETDADDEPPELPPPSSLGAGLGAAQGVDVSGAPVVVPTLSDAPAPDAEERKKAPSAPLPAMEAAIALPENDDSTSTRRTRMLLVGLGSAFVAVIASSFVLYAYMRFGYARGGVLEHLPADCRRLEYVDFAAIDRSPAVSPLLARRDKAIADWAEDLDDEDGFRRTQDDDAKGRASVIRAMKRVGVRPYGDVKEIAFCELHEGDETERLIVVGGTFRGPDLLRALREAFLRRDRKSKDLSFEEVDGRPMMKLDEQRSIIMATGQIAIIGNRKAIARYLAARPVGKAYGIRESELIVRHWAAGADGKGAVDERYEIRGDRLAMVRTWTRVDTSDDVKIWKERFAQAALRLRKVDALEVLADGLESADVRLEGEEGRIEVAWPMKDASKATRAIVDADRREMRAIVDAMRTAPGTEYFHHVVLPGVDYFELRLSPWP